MTYYAIRGFQSDKCLKVGLGVFCVVPILIARFLLPVAPPFAFPNQRFKTMSKSREEVVNEPS